MKHGQQRFEFYLDKLETLLQEATAEKDPGKYLYLNDARTVVFMLEGLAKLYAGIYKKKFFTKIKEHFKLLEDTLGAIDYYDSFAKEFKENPFTPITITAYMQTKTVEKLAFFNKLLVKEKWMGEKANRVSKIRKRLKGASWEKDKKEIKDIASFYHEAIEEIKVLALESEKGFTEIEEEVHELRRKLRWLSIYPKALQGAIQLNDSGTLRPGGEKYLTPEIVQSPFNIMPEPGDNRFFLLLEKNNFLALSWIISALGKLKDSGLRIFALSEALEATEAMDTATATRVALEVLHSGQNELDKILAEASKIAHEYFEGGYLENFVFGGAKV